MEVIISSSDNFVKCYDGMYKIKKLYYGERNDKFVNNVNRVIDEIMLIMINESLTKSYAFFNSNENAIKITQKEMATLTGLSIRTIKRIFDSLIENDFMTPIKKSLYMINPNVACTIKGIFELKELYYDLRNNLLSKL